MIELAVGQKHSFTLEGLGGAGYTWEYSIEGDQDVVAISVTQLGQPPQATPGGLPPDSFSLDTQVTITGLTPGRVILRLQLRRSWERDKPPLKEQVLRIRVQ
jgi:hypothetical protein